MFKIIITGSFIRVRMLKKPESGMCDLCFLPQSVFVARDARRRNAVIRLRLLTLMMTSTQVVETSVTVTDNSLFQDYPHPDDHSIQSIEDVNIKHEKLWFLRFTNYEKRVENTIRLVEYLGRDSSCSEIKCNTCIHVYLL